MLVWSIVSDPFGSLVPPSYPGVALLVSDSLYSVCCPVGALAAGQYSRLTSIGPVVVCEVEFHPGYTRTS